MNFVFKKREEKIDLQQLLEESQSQLLAAQKGQFDYKIKSTEQNEKLQQIIENLNKVSALRQENESRLHQKLDTMLQINKIGFWELE